MDDINSLIDKIDHVIVNPLIILLFSLAVVIFFVGVVQFIIQDSPEKRQQGSRHMLWGVIGIMVMLCVYGIMNFIVDMIKSFYS